MEAKIEQFIKTHSLIQAGSKVLVGLSGGPDSVCLLSLLYNLKDKLNAQLVAAHLDHEARATSKDDLTLCKDLCKELKIKLVTEKISNLKLSKAKGSKEAFWRNVRRTFFEQTAKAENADLIALGHHQQDQQENFLIRLTRGTTLSGLTGIKPKSGMYIRPLLETSKEEILNYLKNNNITYATDESNQSEDYLRNRIRKVLPQLEACDSRFNNNFTRTLESLNAAEQFILRQAKTALENLLTIEGLNTTKLFEIDNYLQPKVVLLWLINSDVKFQLTESFLQEILRFLKHPNGGTHTTNTSWAIQKKQQQAKIIKLK